MSEQINPTTFPPNPSAIVSAPLAPKFSLLAIWSLLLGITGLPAIIIGHVALSQIRRAKGQLDGKALAICGIVVGWLSILVAIALAFMVVFFGFAIFSFGKVMKDQTAVHAAKALNQAISDYESTYGTLPFSETELEANLVTSNNSLMDLLANGRVDPVRNPKGLVFFSNGPELLVSWGLIENEHGFQLNDPWGLPYRVNPAHEDVDGDEMIDRFTISSAGRDGVHGTGDDIKYP